VSGQKWGNLSCWKFRNWCSTENKEITEAGRQIEKQKETEKGILNFKEVQEKMGKSFSLEVL